MPPGVNTHTLRPLHDCPSMTSISALQQESTDAIARLDRSQAVHGNSVRMAIMATNVDRIDKNHASARPKSVITSLEARAVLAHHNGSSLALACMCRNDI